MEAGCTRKYEPRRLINSAAHEKERKGCGVAESKYDPEKDRDVAADSALAYDAQTFACEPAERTSDSPALNHRLHQSPLAGAAPDVPPLPRPTHLVAAPWLRCCLETDKLLFACTPHRCCSFYKRYSCTSRH